MSVARTELRIHVRPVKLGRAPKLVRFAPPDPLEIGAERRERDPAFRRGLVIIGLLTLWLLAWLFVRWLVQPPWLAKLPDIATETVSLVETAGAFTLAFLWAGLGWRYWRRSQQAAQPVPTILTLEKLQSLTPEAFERYVAGLFRQKGYEVVVRGSSGDLGVDLELTGPQGRRAIVQCKRYHNTIGAEIVRELFGTLVHEGVIWAFLVTTADISDAAREWASGKPITLIDGSTLLEVARSLRQKNRGAALQPAELDA
jgi:restriction system protein